MEFVKAPGFPYWQVYMWCEWCTRSIFDLDGTCNCKLRKPKLKADRHHGKIVITIPYGVNKAELIKYIADLVNDKKIEGISNANDESDRDGMRIVIDIKRDANASVVLNKLYKMTALQTSFGVNNVALVHGRPKTLNLRDLIKYFIEHRHEVVIRRTQFDLRKAKERYTRILEGLIIIRIILMK